MNYFVPKFDGVVLGLNFKFYKNVVYNLELDGENNLLFDGQNILPFVLPNKNITQVKFNGDNYFFAYPKPSNELVCFTLSDKQNYYQICLMENLTITKNGAVAFSREANNLSYIKQEMFLNNFILHFIDNSTNRKFFVVITQNKIYADYFDEINISKKEIYFLTRIQDCLNHGKVYHLTQTMENYLVYLDDFDMNLKPELILPVFLDCVKCKNISYLKNLLTEETQAENLLKFLPEFDDYLVCESKAILLKKHTLVGVYAFEISNLKIENITEC